jgi:hypothetical protein
LLIIAFVGPDLGALTLRLGEPDLLRLQSEVPGDELFDSKSPSHLAVVAKMTSNAFPVGAIILPLGRIISPVKVLWRE